jgi:cysteinyl-tRNA synthetase
MNDDFNTPEALAVLFDAAREINRLRDANQEMLATHLAKALREMGAIFGILQNAPEKFLQQGALADTDIAQQIEELIAARNNARKNKNWGEADKIRKQLDDMGIVLEDTAAGTTWRRKD